jgi:hypothetical protein
MDPLMITEVKHLTTLLRVTAVHALSASEIQRCDVAYLAASTTRKLGRTQVVSDFIQLARTLHSAGPKRQREIATTPVFAPNIPPTVSQKRHKMRPIAIHPKHASSNDTRLPESKHDFNQSGDVHCVAHMDSSDVDASPPVIAIDVLEQALLREMQTADQMFRQHVIPAHVVRTSKENIEWWETFNHQ